MSDGAIPKSTAAAQTLAGKTGGRISRRFRELAEAGELGLVAYITAGDPSLDATEKIVLAAAEAGADVIELGVPFSDPVADGPTIQRASERAVRNGTTLAGVIELVRSLRAHTEVPLVLFSYFNPILQMGIEKFAEAASAAGADGVLATDLTPEEAVEYRAVLHARGLDTIFLAAPTSTDERLARIAEASTGFLYLVSRTGVTGTREVLPEGLPALARRVRQFTTLPIAVVLAAFVARYWNHPAAVTPTSGAKLARITSRKRARASLKTEKPEKMASTIAVSGMSDTIVE